MPVQFVCTYCAQLLSVGSRKIGTEVECPRCRRNLTVPDPETAAASVAMRQAQRAPAPESPLPEFLVYDEPETSALDAPPVIITDRPVQPPPLPVRAPPPLPNSTTSDPLWQKLTPQRGCQPMLLISRRTLYVQAGILGFTTLAAFGLGYLIGFGVAPKSAASPAAQAGEATLVQGFIRYSTETGEVLGDAGAVVMALPDGRLPNPKLGVQGLRPADPEPVAGGGVLMSLELLGGATTRVGLDGGYSLAVNEPGRYFLLIISRNTQRPPGNDLDEFQQALLERYFQPANQLIGAQKYLWRVETLPAGTTNRTHDFGRSGKE